MGTMGLSLDEGITTSDPSEAYTKELVAAQADKVILLTDSSKTGKATFAVVQAEDEIAGICSAIGAAFGGSLAATTTSGPGLSLKTEAMGLAVMTELPLVIIDVMRAGPSTGGGAWATAPARTSAPAVAITAG